jgi:hypothetical protein
MSKLLTFLRSFQSGPFFQKYALHAWFAALVIVFFGARFPHHRTVVVAAGLIATALKEFGFDMHWQIPVQTFAEALEDFEGYLIGGTLGAFLLILL